MVLNQFHISCILLENLKSENVIDVCRITKRRNDQIILTCHIILTFNGPNLSNRIKAEYLSCSVRPYIPDHLQRFQCQSYGHSKTLCRGSVTCARYAEVGHDNKHVRKLNAELIAKEITQLILKPALNEIFEKEIQAVKITNKIAYPEARRLIESRYYLMQPKNFSDASTQSLPAQHLFLQKLPGL